MVEGWRWGWRGPASEWGEGRAERTSGADERVGARGGGVHRTGMETRKMIVAGQRTVFSALKKTTAIEAMMIVKSASTPASSTHL